jgi:hypothetical protein
MVCICKIKKGVKKFVFYYVIVIIYTLLYAAFDKKNPCVLRVWICMYASDLKLKSIEAFKDNIKIKIKIINKQV